MVEVTVRQARAGDEAAICAVCSAGSAASSRGLVDDEEVARRIAEYYDPVRVRGELAPSPPGWSGYLVADVDGSVVGAVGGASDAEVGHVLVLYLDLTLRGRGIGTALLDRLSGRQRDAGARRQRVSVTEGNEVCRSIGPAGSARWTAGRSGPARSRVGRRTRC